MRHDIVTFEEAYEILKDQGNRVCQVTWSDVADEISAIQNIKKQLSVVIDPDLIVYFVLPYQNVNALNVEMAEKFCLSQTVGCYITGDSISNLPCSKDMLDKLQFFLAFCFY